MKQLVTSDWLAQLGSAEYCMLFKQYSCVEVRAGFFSKILDKISAVLIYVPSYHVEGNKCRIMLS